MRLLPATLLVCLFAASHLNAHQWPQWRGPARDGVIPASQAPTTFPSSYQVGWAVDVGEGYASPVVADGRVFVHSRHDPAEVVTAVDLETGRTIWQQTYQASYTKNSYASEMARGPNATPLVDGGRLYTIGATAIVIAWDAATGRELWRRDFSREVDFSKLFCGTAASPLLVGGRLVVQVGSDVHGGGVLALDPATGADVWQWRGLGPGYASPVVVTAGGIAQIVTMTNGSIIGLDAGSGRELWSVAFPDDWHENIVTPVWTGRHLIVSGTRQGTQAYRLSSTGGRWTAERVWQSTEASMYMSTPVAADGVIYGLSNKRRGHFVAIDETTGAVRWQTEGREATNASVLVTPTAVVYLTDGATLVVARRESATFDAQRIQLPTSATWTTPVVLGRDLIVKDASRLVRLRGASE
ncbi:MAG TPA: PQQ-binding-like beta-propeller repeat protein [Vicinamibacterales bacterium]|nr:PQQ-binding-like beta-propeller repeat protein [Vicinamibacterales bacterium]